VLRAAYVKQELPMNRDRLRRNALRIFAAAAVGVGLVVGVGVANAETTPADGTGTVTYIKVVDPGTATADDTHWE
jgi:hypothetical protein